MEHYLEWLRDLSHKYLASYWAFPVVVMVVMLALSFAGISGSSLGSYDGLLNNDTSKFGSVPMRPRAVRSDEWLVNTQMTVAQAKDGFPVHNNRVGLGQDMAVVLDVPYKDWSILLRPQNLIFFIAPLNFAFAFKWWFLAATLAISTYVFFLKILPRQKIAAILLAATIFWTPMIQWWYQSITILPIVYGLLLTTLLFSIHESRTRRKRLLLGAGFAYCLVAFALVIYPPFQIPIVLAVLGCYFAYLILSLRRTDHRQRMKLCRAFGVIICSGALAGILIGLFVLQHQSAISAISQTSYPGHRTIDAGDYSFLHLADNYLSPFQQSSDSVAHYQELKGGANQSEISSFVFPILPLLVIGIYALYVSRSIIAENKRAYALVAGSVSVLIIFLLRLLAHVGSPLYKLIGLGFVPHNRLLIGVGFSCVLLLVGTASLLQRHIKRFGTLSYTAICVALIIYYSLVTRAVIVHDPGYITNPFVVACTIIATIVFLLLLIRGNLRLSLLAILSLAVASTILVNPLDRNLDEVTNTQLAGLIQSVAKENPNARWAAYDGIFFENYALANGAKTLTATYTYPQLSLWKKIDFSGHSSDTYNRYAHVELNLDDTTKKPSVNLLGPDHFELRASACDDFLKDMNVDYFYGPSVLSSKCLSLFRHYTYTKGQIYVYKRSDT